MSRKLLVGIVLVVMAVFAGAAWAKTEVVDQRCNPIELGADWGPGYDTRAGFFSPNLFFAQTFKHDANKPGLLTAVEIQMGWYGYAHTFAQGEPVFLDVVATSGGSPPSYPVTPTSLLGTALFTCPSWLEQTYLMAYSEKYGSDYGMVRFDFSPAIDISSYTSPESLAWVLRVYNTLGPNEYGYPGSWVMIGQLDWWNYYPSGRGFRSNSQGGTWLNNVVPGQPPSIVYTVVNTTPSGASQLQDLPFITWTMDAVPAAGVSAATVTNMINADNVLDAAAIAAAIAEDNVTDDATYVGIDELVDGDYIDHVHVKGSGSNVTGLPVDVSTVRKAPK